MPSVAAADSGLLWLTLIFATGATGYGVWLFQKTLVIREWEQGAATIVSSDWKMSRYGGIAIVQYSFEVNGRTYSSSRISIDDWLIAQGAWQVHSMLRKFPLGKTVPVFFDPAKPERSVLLRPGYGWPLAFLCTAIASVAGYMIVSGKE